MFRLIRLNGSQVGSAIAGALSVAIGVAVNLTVFRAVRDVYWAPLPYANGDRLVGITYSQPDGTVPFLTDGDLRQLHQHSGAFEALATIECWPASRRGWTDALVPSGTVRVSAGFASPNLFTVLGVEAAIGRTFAAGDYAASSPPVVLSDRFYRTHLAPHDGTPGSRLRIDGRWHIVVGVLPSRFVAPLPVVDRRPAFPDIDVWLLQDPAQVTGVPGGRAYRYRTLGLLRQKATPEQTAAVSDTLRRSVRATGAGSTTLWHARDLRSELSSAERGYLAALSWLSALLLSISIANLATLQMTQTASHAEHMTIRSALGATGWRLWRVPVSASMAVVVGGTLAGCLAASLAGSVTSHLIPAAKGTAGTGSNVGVPALCAVVMFVAVIGSVAGLPLIARRLFRRRTAMPFRLAEERRRPHDPITGSLVVAMIVLVAPAVGLWRTIKSTDESSPLMARDDIVVTDAWMIPRNGTEPDVLRRIQDRLVVRASSIPGVRAVGTSSDIPFQGLADPNYIVTVPGSGRRVLAYGGNVDAGYFAVLGLRALAGRVFDGTDRADGRLVAVLSESLSIAAFGTTDVIGRQVKWHGSRDVVGVVPDQGFGRAPGERRRTLYTLRTQEPTMRFCLFVQAAGTGGVPGILRDLPRIDADQPWDTVNPLPVVMEKVFEKQRAYAKAAGLLASCGVGLGLLGIFIAANRFVSNRAHEIAIRVTVGATVASVVTLATSCYLRTFATAVVVAVPFAALLSRWMERAAGPLEIHTGAALLVSIASTAVVGACVVAGTVWRQSQARLVTRE